LIYRIASADLTGLQQYDKDHERFSRSVRSLGCVHLFQSLELWKRFHPSQTETVRPERKSPRGYQGAWQTGFGKSVLLFTFQRDLAQPNPRK